MQDDSVRHTAEFMDARNRDCKTVAVRARDGESTYGKQGGERLSHGEIIAYLD